MGGGREAEREGWERAGAEFRRMGGEVLLRITKHSFHSIERKYRDGERLEWVVTLERRSIKVVDRGMQGEKLGPSLSFR